MKFKMIHENYNVSDLDRSIKFYNEALDLHEVRRKTPSRSGFGSKSPFYRAFVCQTGMTPKRYAARERKAR